MACGACYPWVFRGWYQQLRRKLERVTGSVHRLSMEMPSQLAAQLIGISTLIGFVFTFSFVINLALESS